MESDHERIARLTKSLMLALNPEDAVGFDCSECGDLFKNIEELKRHITEYHKEDLMKDSSVKSVKSEEYRIEETGGKKVKDDRPGMEAFYSNMEKDEPTGMNLKEKA